MHDDSQSRAVPFSGSEAGMLQAQPSAADPLSALPEAALSYGAQVVGTVQRYVQDHLVGVYLFGSAAYGAYEPGISDLDIQAVVALPQPQPVYEQLAQDLSHARLPCPARKLEFVIYTQSAVNPAARHPRFDMNFNTGRAEPDHFTLDPATESSHWFLIDIAMGRELGRSLVGPEPARVFAPIPRLWQLDALADSLAWHGAYDVATANNVFNACRGWRYALTGKWGSKLAGALWAKQQPTCPPVVEAALQRRQNGAALSSAAVAELTSVVTAAVLAALRAERGAATPG